MAGGVVIGHTHEVEPTPNCGVDNLMHGARARTAAALGTTESVIREAQLPVIRFLFCGSVDRDQVAGVIQI